MCDFLLIHVVIFFPINLIISIIQRFFFSAQYTMYIIVIKITILSWIQNDGTRRFSKENNLRRRSDQMF